MRALLPPFTDASTRASFRTFPPMLCHPPVPVLHVSGVFQHFPHFLSIPMAVLCRFATVAREMAVRGRGGPGMFRYLSGPTPPPSSSFPPSAHASTCSDYAPSDHKLHILQHCAVPAMPLWFAPATSRPAGMGELPEPLLLKPTGTAAVDGGWRLAVRGWWS